MNTNSVSNWRGRIVPVGDKLLAELRQEFTLIEIVSITVALKRAVHRAMNGETLSRWRDGRGFSTIEAAKWLGWAVEDVEAIEGGIATFDAAGMRKIRPGLRRVKAELGIGRDDEDE